MSVVKGHLVVVLDDAMLINENGMCSDDMTRLATSNPGRVES